MGVLKYGSDARATPPNWSSEAELVRNEPMLCPSVSRIARIPAKSADFT